MRVITLELVLATKTWLATQSPRALIVSRGLTKHCWCPSQPWDNRGVFRYQDIDQRAKVLGPLMGGT